MKILVIFITVAFLGASQFSSAATTQAAECNINNDIQADIKECY